MGKGKPAEPGNYTHTHTYIYTHIYIHKPTVALVVHARGEGHGLVGDGLRVAEDVDGGAPDGGEEHLSWNRGGWGYIWGDGCVVGGWG